MGQSNQSEAVVDKAVAEGGSYEIIRKRLEQQGRQLDQQARALNEARLEEFGSSAMDVVARVRVRTEHNCVARDIVQVGPYLLFGFNVFIGLKKETKVKDVFALFTLESNDKKYEIAPVDFAGTFLSDQSFVSDFEELYRYYKHTRLVELTINNGKLLAGFQIGERLEDIRVFRWSISADGKAVKYTDNRGERDIQLPPSYDFEWTEVGRDQLIHGRHSHINILDKVFVETLGGDLTIKVENNTEDGLGVYREPVEDSTQSLDDAEIYYAEVGELILLKILPYQETQYRYLIFNTFNQSVLRIDAIGGSCVQLPEDHGIIFPGGYYLNTGEHKIFDAGAAAMKFKKVIRSPNGEDVLYVFYEPEAGKVGLLGYNMISKELKNPIYGHGYALSEGGQVVIFSSEAEPTRVHPMQIWKTPYVSDEFASKVPASQTFYGRIGNAELVRGISDLFSICRMANNQNVSSRLYEEISQSATKFSDSHYWIGEEAASSIQASLKEITDTAELVIDEFEKVKSIRQQSQKTMRQAEQAQSELVREIRTHSGESTEEFVNTLSKLRRQRGHLATIKEHRYIDVDRVKELDRELAKEEQHLSELTVDFLSRENALDPFLKQIKKIDSDVVVAQTNATLEPLVEIIENMASGLDLLSELMSTLKVNDATVRTGIIDAISKVYSKLNQSKAKANHKQKNLGKEEAAAQFGAQFKLFSQTITNALGLSVTPEKCDEQMSRLLVQIEELEGQFSDFDSYLADIMEKREEVYEAFEAHKQRLLDERQRKAQSVSDAADRILKNIEKRSLKFTNEDELNTYFASDALVLKIRELIQQLRELDSAVKADDIDARFKAAKEQALRSLRDKTEIFEDGGSIIKLGPRHRFSVNTQDLDLTIIPRRDELTIHLTGTDFYETIQDQELSELRHCWDLAMESESVTVYRAEYLADQIIQAGRQHESGLSYEQLRAALTDPEVMMTLVRDFASPRYKEGYEKGIHDHDAALIISEIIPAMERADLLRFDPLSRGLAQIFWANRIKAAKQTKNRKESIGESGVLDTLSHETWAERAQSAAQMVSVFSSNEAIMLLVQEVRETLSEFTDKHSLPVSQLDIHRAADYLVAELSRDRVEFISSKYATDLVDELKRAMDDGTWRRYQMALEKMLGWPAERWNLSAAWLEALINDKGLFQLRRYIPEAVALINSDERLDRRFTQVDLEIRVEGLLGDHPTIENQSLNFGLDEYLLKLEHHRYEIIPEYRRYLQVRQEIIDRERSGLGLESFRPRPLSSFVRNKLINDAYLPIIGDNLAKQMGTAGESKRTDLMGLLMMISPPGYGKTTLMEYVANRLGLIFMKINCPALGHNVLSLDPAQAPNATAKQELNKLNLGLEMGNNVMLYLDDIQHTHPELLQKFISLCDGTRRIEGVWKDQTKTYDMRGKKFCVVMAGNPYTESGELFKIPDMLANRADIYNLGDILGGMDEQFALSYIENAMTSNSILAPLATRKIEDVYKLVQLAKGESIATTDLNHQYSGAELKEITDVLKKMFLVQEVVLKINQQYIASAAQNDNYRTEPPFKLQGSYRNMNKMAEKISSVMNESELMQMIQDHYLGEAQLLTTGAEDNLLKLAELRGNMTEAQIQRWKQIKKDFLRNKAMGGDDADTGAKVVAQLADLVEGLHSFESQTVAALSKDSTAKKLRSQHPEKLEISEKTLTILQKIMADNRSNVEVVNQPVPGIDKFLKALADTMENSIFPLIRTMDKKLEIDLRNYDAMQDVSRQLQDLKNTFNKQQITSNFETKEEESYNESVKRRKPKSKKHSE